MPYTTLFFDLDDTLYSSSNGLWEAIRGRMNDYMTEVMGLPAAEVPELRKLYFEKYGTTLRGLQKHYHVDADEFLAYVHHLPLDQYLKPDPFLRKLLLSLPQRRWIFTNADDAHAGRVLACLGLSGCFEGIIDVRAMEFACKPEVEAYRRAMCIAGEADPRCCALFDDALRNLLPAQAMGFFTVLVGNGGHSAGFPSVNRLHDLWQVFPEIFTPSEVVKIHEQQTSLP